MAVYEGARVPVQQGTVGPGRGSRFVFGVPLPEFHITVEAVAP
jgi:hypothetical protein